MALINLQTQQPSLKKSIVSSSVFRSSAPIASVAKIPFGGVARSAGFSPKPLNVGAIDQPSEPSALYGIVEALKVDVQSLRQEQNEAGEIIGDIGNALAADFANRITEEKAQNRFLNKQRIKLRRKEKEENLEKKTASNALGFTGIGKGMRGAGGGIFGKLMQFFTTIGTGLALTTVFKWLQNKENRESLTSVFKAITDHWKWIVGAIGAFVVADLGLKLAGLASVFGILGPILTSPLFWIGAGIVMAAAHQGAGPAEKQVIKDLQLMGGANEQNRDALIAQKQSLINEEMAKPLLMRRPGFIQNLEKDINFIKSGEFGHGFGGPKNINWEAFNETNKVVMTDKRHAGGSITKGRMYAIEPGEIPFKAGFTGTMATATRAGQLLSSRGGRTTIINMPPEVIEGKLPEIKGDTPIATHVDPINSMNQLNPYMSETPSILGITV